MKNKKLITNLIAMMLAFACLSFAGCKDETDSGKNSTNTSNNKYDNLYDDEDEWTNNH